MNRAFNLTRLAFGLSILLAAGDVIFAQRVSKNHLSEEQFGPVMRAYLGYLRNEQEVVDDRISRREISAAYYRRNSERIRALRQMAIRLVNQSGNDYVPELEAVALDEFRTLFEQPPRPGSLRANQIVANKFRYLGSEQTGETFFLFARLDPYEQAALVEQQSKNNSAKTTDSAGGAPKGQAVGQSSTRPRRSTPR
jgi:hypothetical protein